MNASHQAGGSQLIAGIDDIGVSEEEGQEAELLGQERNDLACAPDLVLVQVDGQVAVAQEVATAFVKSLLGEADASEDRAEPIFRRQAGLNW